MRCWNLHFDILTHNFSECDLLKEGAFKQRHSNDVGEAQLHHGQCHYKESSGAAKGRH